jgi:hypothetical protein
MGAVYFLGYSLLTGKQIFLRLETNVKMELKNMRAWCKLM